MPDSPLKSGLAVFDDALHEALTRWDLSPSTAQRTQLRVHYQAMVEANRRINLTRITEPRRAAVLHYADSLALLLWARQRGVRSHTVLDIGTGAGFPAVPLAVLRPEWSVTAIDGTAKKTVFLARTVADMGLVNLRPIHAHSGHWQPGEAFPLVVLRAVASLATDLQQAARHVALRGWIVAYKTAALDARERGAAAKAASKLKLRAHQPFPYDLDVGGETARRALHVYERAG